MTYIPTTEQVRLAYTGDEPDCICCPNYLEEAGPEFDSWYAEEIRKAKREAWQEGYWLGINGHTGPGNPYTEETK